MSNIRDERMQKTFRDENVKFFRPEVQQKDWFNILTVHQNQSVYRESTIKLSGSYMLTFS